MVADDSEVSACTARTAAFCCARSGRSVRNRVSARPMDTAKISWLNIALSEDRGVGDARQTGRRRLAPVAGTASFDPFRRAWRSHGFLPTVPPPAEEDVVPASLAPTRWMGPRPASLILGCGIAALS